MSQTETMADARRLLRKINDMVTRTGPTPRMKAGSVHDTFDLALDEIKLVASGALAWERDHRGGQCRHCASHPEPWDCGGSPAWPGG